jgi:hypothetical protein
MTAGSDGVLQVADPMLQDTTDAILTELNVKLEPAGAPAMGNVR